MYNVAIDSKLRGCDLVRLRVADVHLGDSIRLRTTIIQQKTGRPIPFELTEPTREALALWLSLRGSRSNDDWLFPSLGPTVMLFFQSPRQRASRPLHALVGHTDAVLCLSFSRDGDRLASGSRDKTAKIWDVRSGHQALSLRGHPNWVNSAVFGPDDRLVITSSEHLRVWDASPCTSEAKAAVRDQAAATAPAWHRSEAGKCLASDPPYWFGLVFHAHHFSGRVIHP